MIFVSMRNCTFNTKLNFFEFLLSSTFQNTEKLLESHCFYFNTFIFLLLKMPINETIRRNVTNNTNTVEQTRKMEHSYDKPEIPGQTVCYKQEFVISEQFSMRYCSTWLRSLLCYIKKIVIEEFIIRVFQCKW